MEVLKKYKRLIFFYLLVNLLVGCFITLSSYVHIPLNTLKDYAYYTIHFLLLQFSLFGIVYILTINRYVFYLLFLPLFFVLSIIAFWGFTQDISLTSGVIQASLETKRDIIIDLVSWQLVVFILLVVVAIFIMLKYYKKIDVPKFNYILLIISILSFFTFSYVEKKRGGTFKKKLPYTLYYESKNFYNKNKVNFRELNEELNAENKEIQFVFVLGESVRADHLQLNGYERETTPLLNQKQNIISFPNAFTTNTYTGASIPQILSDASVYDDYETPKYSLIDVINKAKIPTIWIGNQTPERSYIYFIKNSKKSLYIDPMHSEFSFNKELDEKMIPIYKEELEPPGGKFITIHMMGSHWWYENRYTTSFRKFKPVIKSKYIPSNSPQEMINSYDNTILYLDYFLNELIEELEKSAQPSILFYVSDHGELLGENGKWLHAQVGDEKAVKNPAFIVWYSKEFQRRFPEKVEKLIENRNKYLPLDFFYHSVLDVYGIKGIKFNENLSVFGNFMFQQPEISQ